MASPRLETILDSGYLHGLEDLTIDEVRARRAECQAVEVALSYARRLVQGRLDIIGAEVEGRANGAGPSTVAEIVERLQAGDMLSGQDRPSGFGRLPTLLAPDQDDLDEITQEALDVADTADLDRVPELNEAELGELADRLSTYERTLSDQRRLVFERIDAVQAEVVRRYKSGAADISTLLK